MNFSSLEFLFLFLPVTLILYYLTPLKWRNGVLLAVSLLFYGWGEPVYVALMVGTIVMDYLFGFLVGKTRMKPAGRRWLAVSVAANLLILGFFKYADFMLDNLRLLPFLSSLPRLNVALPIGISFYTFQALSYVVDVYRGEAQTQKSLVRFGTYIALFPQLIAGPIVRYNDIETQLDVEQRQSAMNLVNFSAGIRTFCVGLGKKILLANTAGELWNTFCLMPIAERSAAGAWLGLIFRALQIYFDFSGYSDMAIGLGRMLGFRFAENFYYPYVTDSITDFWRRWHISLSTWFREYVYIPLGGNRHGVSRTLFNLLVTWLLTGFWHGAKWNYVLWGLYFFLLLALEKFVWGKTLQKCPAILRHIYALFFILVGWLIFSFEDVPAGLAYARTLIGLDGGFIRGGDIWELSRNGFFLLICLYACTPHPRRLYYRALSRRPKLTGALSAAASLALLLLCTAYLVNSSYNPFLYFRF